MLTADLRPPPTVGRLRARGPDSPALRLAARALVGAADIRPPGLPPAAVLVVRSLSDPLPGRLSERVSVVDRAWSAAASAALDDLVRRAARPADGPVDPTAPAVVFRDIAELLACLMADLAAGDVGGRWWWRRLSPGGDAAAVAHTLERYAPAVPAGVALLAPGVTSAALAAMGPHLTAQVVTAVAAAHQVPPPARAGARHDVQGWEPPSEPVRPDDVAAAAEGWLRSVATPAPGGPARHEPPAADASALSRAFGEIGSALAPAGPERTPSATPSVAVRAPASDATPLPVGTVPPGPGEAERPARPHPSIAPLGEATAETASAPEAEPADRAPLAGAPVPTAPDSRREAPRADLARAAPAVAAGGAEAARESIPVDGAAESPLLTPRPTEAVDSSLAGVFFLVNALASWGEVDAVARLFLAGEPDAALDALWGVLADLDGRPPDEPPGVPEDVAGPLADALAVRLAEALDLPPGEAVREALVRPGRIWVTSSHVDVVYPLATASLALRRAGLDRDPGWQPAFGRVVTFHFEESPFEESQFEGSRQ